MGNPASSWASDLTEFEFQTAAMVMLVHLVHFWCILGVILRSQPWLRGHKITKKCYYQRKLPFKKHLFFF